MKRFQTLVKKKIKQELSHDEAQELHELLQRDKNCRVVMRLLFEKTVEDRSGAEKAYAVHRRKIRPLTKERQL